MYDETPQENTLYIASEIEDHQYENRTDIERVEMIDVENIGAYAFAGCTNLREINIPDSVRMIGNFAFKGCVSLRQMWIPDCTRIAENAFDGTRFTCFVSADDHGIDADGEFEIRNGVLRKYNGNNTRVTVPDEVKAIGSHAFFLLKELESVTLPGGVHMIANSAFFGSGLRDITLPDSLKIISAEAFSCCRQLESITLNDGVTEIGEAAFRNCESLKSITIPDSVSEIGEDAFLRCESLKSITIPDSVSEIGEDAFLFCDDLTIRGKKGSEAERYSKENGISFEEV